MGVLKGRLLKAGVVGAAGAVLSVAVLSGTAMVPIAGGVFLPKFVVHGVILAGSSIGASYIVPAVVPWVSAGSAPLKRFENLCIEPLVLGTVALVAESILAPSAQVVGPGGTVRTILVGSAASIGGAYFAEGLSLTESVI